MVQYWLVIHRGPYIFQQFKKNNIRFDFYIKDKKSRFSTDQNDLNNLGIRSSKDHFQTRPVVFDEIL